MIFYTRTENHKPAIQPGKLPIQQTSESIFRHHPLILFQIPENILLLSGNNHFPYKQEIDLRLYAYTLSLYHGAGRQLWHEI